MTRIATSQLISVGIILQFSDNCTKRTKANKET